CTPASTAGRYQNRHLHARRRRASARRARASTACASLARPGDRGRHAHTRGGVPMSWRSREELAHQVVTLKAQGMAGSAIARPVGVSRNTVKSLLRAHGSARETGHAALAPRPARVPPAQKLDAFRPKVPELMTPFP